MYTLAIHGGAGTILRSQLTTMKEKEYLDALDKALLAGEQVLEKGGLALDAVEVSVKSLEDCSLFNAGIGSVFTYSNKHEMDASIMDGSNLMAGAVSAIKSIKNPVSLAKHIMLHSEHVFLSGVQAEQYATEQGFKNESDSVFFTAHRFEQWLSAFENDSIVLDHTGYSLVEKKFGTVGAVAMDLHGNLAAATSTGGMTNKKFGRVGDTPLIGAGNYANNSTCAVSCTGHGEFFIRSVVAYDISCLMEYKGLSLAAACEVVVQKKLKALGGEGGVIAVDKDGNHCLCFNSEGMYRGFCNSKGEKQMMIYDN